MHTETLLSARLQSAGLRVEDIAFDRAVALYLNSGGTIERARARLEVAAERMRGKGQLGGADNGRAEFADPVLSDPLHRGHESYADNSQTQRAPMQRNETLGEGPIEDADGRLPAANTQQPQADGMDQITDAVTGHLAFVSPVREPSIAQIAARSKVKEDIALSVFDREKTRTGQMWGNVYYRELDQFVVDADIAQAVKSYIGHIRGDDRYKMIRELMTPRQFAILLSKIRAEKNHAA